MAHIRPMRPVDLKEVEYVCRMTAGPGCQRDPVLGYRIARMFSTYYVRECYDTCFVLVDDSDKVVGYILCEPDYKRYNKIFRKVDVPEIKKLDKASGRSAWLFPIPYTFFGRKYPAHLHIDILDEYQNQGFGGKLMDALFTELKSRNVKGVMLQADIHNEGAVRFYKRLGFKMLSTKLKTATMAKNLF